MSKLADQAPVDTVPDIDVDGGTETGNPAPAGSDPAASGDPVGWRRIAALAASAARTRLGQTVLGLVVMVAVFAWGLPTFASYSSVWASLSDLDGRWLAPLLVAGALNPITSSFSHRAALPGLRIGDALMIDWTTSAITNTIPGGSAIATGMTWSMYRTVGFAPTSVLRCLVVTTVWHTFVKFGTPLLALIWLSTERPVSTGLVQATVLGAVLFIVVVALGAVLLGGPRVTNRLGALLDRLPATGHGWQAKLENLRQDTLWFLKHRWRSLTWWTLFGHGTYYLLLVLCLRAVGVSSSELSMAAILSALAFGRLITAVPITPGGLGIMELGLTTVLVGVGSADESAVVAAVLLFRFLTFALPIPLGAVSWLVWTQIRSGRNPADVSPEVGLAAT